MSKAVVYATPICPYCAKAKALLEKLGIAYTVIDVSKDEESRQEMIRLCAGRTSVPQVFIEGAHIGGYDDLYALYQAGGLEKYQTH